MNRRKKTQFFFAHGLSEPSTHCNSLLAEDRSINMIKKIKWKLFIKYTWLIVYLIFLMFSLFVNPLYIYPVILGPIQTNNGKNVYITRTFILKELQVLWKLLHQAYLVELQRFTILRISYLRRIWDSVKCTFIKTLIAISENIQAMITETHKH